MKVLIINGPNINLIGIREVSIYGTQTYQDLVQFIHTVASNLKMECEVFQSNHEGVLIDAIQEARLLYDGIIINGGGYTHTSIAIMDALKSIHLPVIEVHLSDIKNREDFRKFSYLSLVSVETICGLGFKGYELSLEKMKEILRKKI